MTCAEAVSEARDMWCSDNLVLLLHPTNCMSKEGKGVIVSSEGINVGELNDSKGLYMLG